MLYLDTSVLVALVSRESATARLQDWLDAQNDALAISHWSVLEFASAVAVKQRAGDLDPADRIAGLGWFDSFKDEAAALWPVRSTAFRRATELINVAGVKVRGADALHLAIAEERGATLCTLDDEQAKAGRAAEIATQLL